MEVSEITAKEITLMHEDIYVYIDPVELITQKKSGINIDFTHDGRKDINTIGKLTLESEGLFTSISLIVGDERINLPVTLDAGETLILDFPNNHFTKNGDVIFLPKMLEEVKNKFVLLNVELVGRGDAEVEYEYLKAITNHHDLMFCTSLDTSEDNEIISKTNIHGGISYRDVETKTYNWSINGLWNKEEIKKFKTPTGLFRLRFVDDQGEELESLSQCMISGTNKSSGEEGDYTFSVSGICKGIF